jgi:hypothetical protein
MMAAADDSEAVPSSADLIRAARDAFDSGESGTLSDQLLRRARHEVESRVEPGSRLDDLRSRSGVDLPDEAEVQAAVEAATAKVDEARAAAQDAARRAEERLRSTRPEPTPQATPPPAPPPSSRPQPPRPRRRRPAPPSEAPPDPLRPARRRRIPRWVIFVGALALLRLLRDVG